MRELGCAACPGPPALERRPLLVGKATPDSVLLVRVHCELEAGTAYRAALADRLRARFPSLLLELGFALLTKEKDVVVLPTGGLLLPVQPLGGIGESQFLLLLLLRRLSAPCS